MSLRRRNSCLNRSRAGRVDPAHGFEGDQLSAFLVVRLEDNAHAPCPESPQQGESGEVEDRPQERELGERFDRTVEIEVKSIFRRGGKCAVECVVRAFAACRRLVSRRGLRLAAVLSSVIVS